MGKVGIIGVGQSAFVRGYPGSIRELAFEGERFYDLMRVAQRRGDNAYLADRIAAKFSGIAQKWADDSHCTGRHT